MGNSTANNMRHYVFCIVMILIMVAGFYIPENDILPAYGWQVLFILLGLIVGWSLCGLIMPSILGMTALAFTENFTITSVWQAGFGSEIVILIILFCIFSKWLEKIGFTNTLVNWFLTRKAFIGRPYLFITFFFLVVYVLAFFTNTYPALFIGWACVYKLCDVLGYEKRSPFCAFLVFNVIVISNMGDSCKPWSIWGLTAINTYTSAVGTAMEYAPYMLWTTIVFWTAISIMLLFGKYVMKINMDNYLKGDYREAASHFTFDSLQKFGCSLLILLLVVLFVPNYLPDCAVKSFFSRLGTIGVISCVLMIAGFLNLSSGKPLLDFKELASGGAVPWDPVMLVACTMPLGAAIKAPESGVMDLVSTFAIEHMADMSPFVFYVAIAIFMGLLTQVAHNAVCLIAITPIFLQVGMTLNMNTQIILLVAAVMLTAALGSPAGSTRSGLLYGNDEYISLSDCYKFGWFSLLTHIIACCAVGIPLGMLMF